VFRRSAEIGYWLGEPFWGRGIATEALGAMTEYAFAHFDICRLEAGVFEWNPASARVLEKNGYVLEGRARLGVVKDGRLGDRLGRRKCQSVRCPYHEGVEPIERVERGVVDVGGEHASRRLSSTRTRGAPPNRRNARSCNSAQIWALERNVRRRTALRL